MFETVAPENYAKYGKPAAEGFMAAKDAGKSVGGWGSVDKVGKGLSG
mgnify:FL=1